jgi:hypothetical protein
MPLARRLDQGCALLDEAFELSQVSRKPIARFPGL